MAIATSLLGEDYAALVEVNHRFLAVFDHPLSVAVEVLGTRSHAVHHFVCLGVREKAQHSQPVVVRLHWSDGLRSLSLGTRLPLPLEVLLLH